MNPFEVLLRKPNQADDAEMDHTQHMDDEAALNQYPEHALKVTRMSDSTLAAPIHQNFTCSKWNPKGKFASIPERNICMFILDPGERLYFAGAAMIYQYHGTSSVLGYALKCMMYNAKDLPDSHHFYPVYSPKSSSLLFIECASKGSGRPASSHESYTNCISGFDYCKDDDYTFSNRNITSSTTAIHDPKLHDDIVNMKGYLSHCVQGSSFIVVKSIGWAGLFDIERTAPIYKSLFHYESQHENTMDFGVEGFYPLPLLQISQEWLHSKTLIDEATSKLSVHTRKTPIIFVCGGRNVGKSTYCRFLLNSMLLEHPSVGLLDCDPGQTEMTTSGMCSVRTIRHPLLGPPFTHQQLTQTGQSRSIFLGSNSTRQDPDAYLEALFQLTDHFIKMQSEEGDVAPLIVNTQGWIKGMGFDLLVHFINRVSPCSIVCLEPPSGDRISPAEASLYCGIVLSSELSQALYRNIEADADCNEMQILSVASAEDRVSRQKLQASDFRTLALQAYFCQSMGDPGAPVIYSHKGNANEKRWWNFKLLLHQKIPYAVDWDDNISVMVLHGEVAPSQILHSLNGSLVALINDKSASPSQESLRCIPSLSAEAQVLGMGIIRTIVSIPAESEHECPKITFHIVTPMDPSELDNINVIARGSGMDIPSCMFLSGYETTLDDIPYCTRTTAEGFGSTKKRMRYNLQRRKNSGK